MKKLICGIFLTVCLLPFPASAYILAGILGGNGASGGIVLIADAEFSTITSGAALNTAGFSTLTSGSGAVAYSGGYISLTNTGTGAATIVYNTALPTNKSWRVQVKGHYTTTGSNYTAVPFAIVQASSAPSIMSNTTTWIADTSIYPYSSSFLMQVAITTSTSQFWAPTSLTPSASNTTGSWGSSAWQTPTTGLAAGTDNIWQITSNSTGITFQLMDASGNLLFQASQFAWSSIVSTFGNSLWLSVGDILSNSYTTPFDVSYIRVYNQ